MNSTGLPEAYDYRFQVCPNPEEAGGGWIAEVPELEGCISDGDTPEEALKNVQDAMLAWIETAREAGIPIPPPVRLNSTYSGKFTLRVPKSIHARLARCAELENVSLNQFVITLITYGLGVFERNDDLMPSGHIPIAASRDSLVSESNDEKYYGTSTFDEEKKTTVEDLGRSR